MLITLFALSTFTPTDASGAVSTNTVSKASSKKYAKKSSKKRRHRSRCTVASRALGKQQALALVRTQSEDLCKLTGLEYVSTSEAVEEARLQIESDGEEGTSVDQGTAALHNEDEGEVLAELEAEDDVTVDIENFHSMWLNYVDTEANQETDAGIEYKAMMDVIMDWLGTRYHFGGTSRTGIDCSAFTGMVYAIAGNIGLPRTATGQSGVGIRVRTISQLKFGDLVFFHTRRHARVSHVGIYLGDNLFAHSSSRYGVTISSLESTYYGKRFLGGSRIMESDIAASNSEFRIENSEFRSGN
jgi:hypothetical protein